MSARTIASVQREITARWSDIVARARCLPCTLPSDPRVLGESAKTMKGPKSFAMRVSYLCPDRSAFPVGDTRTLCPWATRAAELRKLAVKRGVEVGSLGIGCSGTCLGEHSGQMGNPAPTNARLYRTTLFFGDRVLWRELLDAEIRAFDIACKRAGRVTVVRVDGTSDTGEGRKSAQRHPTVQHLDYSKSAARVLQSLRLPLPNYRVCLSYSGVNEDDCRAVLAAGGVVAAVFDSKPAVKRNGVVTRAAESLPAEFLGAPCHDGDADDLIFLAPPGTVRALRFKTAEKRSIALAEAGIFVVANYWTAARKAA